MNQTNPRARKKHNTRPVSIDNRTCNMTDIAVSSDLQTTINSTGPLTTGLHGGS